MDGHWGEHELGLQPPVALLAWLVRNLAPPRDASDLGDDAVVRKRRQLIDRDTATNSKALELLRSTPAERAWYVLEGRTYPDAFIETPDALVVVEGKRTEAGPTRDTTWMAGRHQIWRHMDAAWEIRGRRLVYGLLIVEGDPTGMIPRRTGPDHRLPRQGMACIFLHGPSSVEPSNSRPAFGEPQRADLLQPASPTAGR